jgi:hypothetical protein
MASQDQPKDIVLVNLSVLAGALVVLYLVLCGCPSITYATQRLSAFCLWRRKRRSGHGGRVHAEEEGVALKTAEEGYGRKAGTGEHEGRKSKPPGGA